MILCAYSYTEGSPLQLSYLRLLCGASC